MVFMKMAKVAVLFLVLVTMTGCSTLLVVEGSTRKETQLTSYYSDINSVTLVDEAIVLDITRSIKKGAKGKLKPVTEHLCFTKDDFAESVITYSYDAIDNPYTCSEELINLSKPVAKLSSVSDLKTGFVIPELNTVIYGKRNDSIDTRCDCALLDSISSLPEHVFTLSNSLFYVELENDEWLKFTENSPTSSIRTFQVSLSDKNAFEQDKALHKNKVTNTTFNRLKRDILKRNAGSYLFIRLPNSKDYIYPYYIDDPSFSSTPILGLVFEGDKTTVVNIREANYWLMGGLLPFALAADFYTWEIQAVILFLFISGNL